MSSSPHVPFRCLLTIAAAWLPQLLFADPRTIRLRAQASPLESLAANEICRYAYLRTGKLLPIKYKNSTGDRIVVTVKDSRFCGNLGQNLAPQQFLLQTAQSDGDTVWWVIGGDELGALYGAYRFAEKLGVRFDLDEDVIPDESLAGPWPSPNETGKPRFAVRGLQPFHDFSVGPDWWNSPDYRNVLSQMAKLRLNFIGFHTYPSWNPAAGPEANVWIGLPEDVDQKGDVRFGYEAGVVTSRRGWAVKPFPTSQYACGAGLLFESDDYAPDFLLDCPDWPKSEPAARAMFNRYGNFQKEVFNQAHRLGIKTCVGTELPLGVPKELAARLTAQRLKPEDPEVIRRLYEGTFLRLKRKLPIDYYWLWASEVWLGSEPGCPGWEVTSRANVERDLRLAEAAAQSVGAPFGLATCGWRLGTRDDALWSDQRTPKNWPASALGTQLGRAPVEKAFGLMKDRPRWEIAWAEDDDAAGAHCCTSWDLQLWVQRMWANSAEAFRYGCEGMMAINWRTAAISPNIRALADAGWDFEDSSSNHPDAAKPALDAWWADWGRSEFGGEIGGQAGRLMQKLDGSHLAINELIRGGASTTDARLAEFFAPLSEMQTLRSRVKTRGNLERFDYWLNFLGATRLRVRTWALAARLAAKVSEVKGMPDSENRKSLARQEVLPLRLEVARSYEAMIAAFLACAKSAGELGTISSIESGMRDKLVSSQDAAITKVLGEPVPAEASLRTAYSEAPRIFVSASGSQIKAGQPEEIRAFVLSGPKSTGLALYWRPLGTGSFKRVAAVHRARQAYRATLPAQSAGVVEYYLEAKLDNGEKLLWPVTAPALNRTAIAW